MIARVRLGILLVLLAATVTYAWYSFAGRSGAAETAVAGPVVVNTDPLHLAPDRRFLIALGDLGRMTAGADTVAAEATYETDHWLVHRGPDRIATLPDPPDYASLRDMVWQEATRLVANTSVVASAGNPAPTGDIDRELRAMHALRALNRADQQWARGDHGAALALRAADAIALLVMETCDQVGASDSLAGRAIALTAVAGVLDSASAKRTECILADELDYGASACAIAASLPETDARRWFVMRDDARLATMADSRERRFLQLVRHARRNDLEAWAPAAATFERDPALALPLMATSLSMRRFESSVGLGAALVACVAGDLAMLDGARGPRNAGSKDDDFGDLMNQFEGLLARMPAASDGPLLDRAVVRSYYRACFYSGIKAISDHLLYALASLPAAKELSASFESAEPGPALEFAQWFKDIVDARTGHRAVDRMRADVKGMSHFGEPMLHATLDEFLNKAPTGVDPGVRVMSHLLAERLDSRPWSRSMFTFMLRQVVVDPVRADDLDASLSSTMHPRETGWHGWWAGYEGDVPALIAIAEDASLTSTERAYALERAERSGSADSAAIMDAHQRFAEASPADFRAVERYVLHCEHRGELARGREAISAWLARKDRSDQAFDEIVALTTLGRLLQKEGRPEEALAAVTPVVASQQFGAMQRASLILEDLGRIAQAETLAVVAWQRYPDSESAVALAVRMLWRAGDDTLAARVLASLPKLISMQEWRETLLPELIALERERPGRALEAVGPLVGLNEVSGMELDRLASEWSRAGYDSLAFAIQSAVHLTRDDQLGGGLRAYRYARNAYGRAMAKDWICAWASKLSPTEQEKLLLLTTWQGAPELMWDLPCPKLHGGDEEENMWLMRAVAATGGDSIPAEHRREVERHFAKRSANRYRIFGRHLLGLDDEKAVLAAPATRRALSEARYYLGLEAEQAGRLRDAASWYARCIELDERLNAEDAWARDRLSHWVADGHSMAWIERQAARERAEKAGS